MKLNVLIGMIVLFFSFSANAQQEDSLDNERLSKMVSLSEVILRTDLNVPSFIDRVKKDTTFYKAFRNLHLLGFTAWNDIRVKDKKGNVIGPYKIYWQNGRLRQKTFYKDGHPTMTQRWTVDGADG